MLHFGTVLFDTADWLSCGERGWGGQHVCDGDFKECLRYRLQIFRHDSFFSGYTFCTFTWRGGFTVWFILRNTSKLRLSVTSCLISAGCYLKIKLHWSTLSSSCRWGKNTLNKWLEYWIVFPVTACGRRTYWWPTAPSKDRSNSPQGVCRAAEKALAPSGPLIPSIFFRTFTANQPEQHQISAHHLTGLMNVS